MTDEEISNLSDEQINAMVTAEVNDISESYHESGENKGKIYQWYSSDELREFSVKDYCNDPAVMWSLIATMVQDDHIVQILKAGVIVTLAGGGRIEHMDANPLRATAIVYLKIKGVL